MEVESLVKTYGRFNALDGLDLRVEPGEVHGFLGPNGSGKSTTIRILLGLARATGGSARLFGRDPWAEAVGLHRRLTYVPGDVALWPRLTGGQCLDVLSAGHGGIPAARRAELLERFALDPTKRARDYSTGNRQKVALVAALGVQADLLVLDEPTSGLDPLMEQVFQQVVRERVAEGATVLLSSHILSEVEALADRVTIIREGRTVTIGSLAELRGATSSHVHAVTVHAPAGLEGLPGVGGLQVQPVAGAAAPGAGAPRGTDTRCRVEPAALPQVVGSLHAAGVQSLTVEPPTLDELFLEQYAGSGEVR
ncbi:ABC transporter ATP-binding protein [Kytococcus sedentarius]|nr:ABC transporter ATP-binding protein [Kytococcus sedentarius]